MSLWLRAWAPALAWGALIYWASAQPTVPVDLQGGRDKVAHFGAYAVLGAALGHVRARLHLPLPLLVLVGWLFALSDEVHQGFVPGRSAELADWVADALGVLAGLFSFNLWRDRDGAGPRARGAWSRSDT